MSAKKGRALTFGALWETSRRCDGPEAVRSAEEQVDACFQQSASTIRGLLTSRYGSLPDAEDVMQEAFLRLYAALQARDRIENPAAWVMRVANHLMLDRMRHGHIERTTGREQRTRLVDVLMRGSDPSTPERVLIDRERLGIIRAAARALSDIERTCLNGRAEGLTLAEIAALVDLDSNRVHRLIGKAIRRLREALRG